MAGPVLNWLGGVLGGVKQGSRVFEPQRMNSALLIVRDLSTFGSSDSLKLSLANFSMPKLQTAPSVIPYLATLRKFAGQSSFEGIQATFYNYVDRSTLATLLNWSYAVYDPRTGQKGYKGTYAKNANIEEYPPQGALDTGDGKTTVWEVEGMWPTLVDPGDYDMGSDEPVRISVHFEIDRAWPSTLPGLNAKDSRNRTDPSITQNV